MGSRDIHPTTIAGIKRLARSIKRERGNTHLAALDVAAQAAGFSNFRHAENALSVPTRSIRPPESGPHEIFITAYWGDGTTGRETLRLSMRAPWKSRLTPRQLADCRRVRLFRAQADDHLCARETLRGQDGARRGVIRAARVMQFIDATGLVPSRAFRRAYPQGNAIRLPDEDHVTLWFDPYSGGYVIADEPYEDPGSSRLKEREEWCAENGFEVVKVKWPGMHYPEGGTSLFLWAMTGTVDLRRLAALLEGSPQPVCMNEWTGDSALAMPPFATPSMQAHRQAGARLPRLSLRSSSVTEGYVQTFVGPQRRPKGRLPVDAHREAARLLNEVLLQSERRKGVKNRVDWVRSELDEWCMREYTPAELPGEDFSNLYYGSYGTSIATIPTDAEREAHVKRLRRVQHIARQHYPDCVPVRKLTGKLDLAITSLEQWRAPTSAGSPGM
jgi:hypothetical protein